MKKQEKLINMVEKLKIVSLILKDIIKLKTRIQKMKMKLKILQMKKKN